MTGLSRAVVALVLVLSALAGAGSPVAPAAAQEACSNEVVHDGYRLDNRTIEHVQETGSTTTSVKNTKVTIEDTETFVRIRASNPNGYCVAVTVELNESVVAPAELGTVHSVEETGKPSIEARWQAVQDLDAGSVYTRVTFTLPAGTSDILFAPSKLRVKTLAWTGTAEKHAGGLFSSLGDRLGLRGDLRESTYTLDGSAGDVVTVDLESGDGRRVEEWHALWQDREGNWHPVGTDASEPVFYQESDSTVTFHFRQTADVEFTANPGFLDKAERDWQSYKASWADLFDVSLPWQGDDE